MKLENEEKYEEELNWAVGVSNDRSYQSRPFMNEWLRMERQRPAVIDLFLVNFISNKLCLITSKKKQYHK